MKLLKFDTYFVVRLEKDEEIITALTQAIRSTQIKGGFFYGLGVGRNLQLGYFDAREQVYTRKEFPDEYEFTSFLGNISWINDELTIHCHVTITDAQFHAYGGHLFRGTVPATLEIVIFPFTKPLTRKRDHATGLNLLELKDNGEK
jgi:predicted DNA-binding protein with PD1-like motif